METDVREAFKNRLNSAIDLCNYLTFNDYNLDKDHLKYNEDVFLLATAKYLSEANQYINNSVNDLMTNDPMFINLVDDGTRALKKDILTAITTLSGVVLSYGKGLSRSKYCHLLKELLANVDPDEILE